MCDWTEGAINRAASRPGGCGLECASDAPSAIHEGTTKPFRYRWDMVVFLRVQQRAGCFCSGFCRIYGVLRGLNKELEFKNADKRPVCLQCSLLLHSTLNPCHLSRSCEEHI